ncbi:MAG: mechanosensitive ion channel family protein [Thermoproteota archaeon]
MTSSSSKEAKNKNEKIGSPRNIAKILFYIVVMIVAFYLIGFAFSTWSLILEPIVGLMPYIQAGVVLLVGYKLVEFVGELVYRSVARTLELDKAAVMKTLVRIGGYAILLSALASVFKIGLEAALTIGSFSGIVMGFASQTILSNAMAGLLLILARPFKIGDEVTVLDQSGIVKDIKLMYTVLETQNGEKEVLIPNNTLINAIISKTRFVDKSPRDNKT